MRAFSISERKILEASPFIVKISPNNSIQYTNEFKKLILDGSEDSSRQQYFNSLLGVSCFDKKYIDTCVNRWKKINTDLPYKESRGRKKDIQKMSIDELKAENAYMKEVINHLKKLRGFTDDEL